MAQQDASTPSATFSIPEVIPIFPLPNVVLFPDTFLPLHIFEPRYREMVADASQGGQCIGMALMKDGWEEGYYGNPPIFPLGCVGRIKTIHQLPDGRSNIILEGLHRYDIQEEYFETSYRRARVMLRSKDPFGSLEDASVRTNLINVATQYLRARQAQDLSKLITGHTLTDGVLVNSLGSCLDFTPLEKQFLLESHNLLQQARRLIDLIQFKMEEHGRKPVWG